MSKIYTRRTMAGIFILVCTAYFVYAVANKPRILVLHSYSTDFVWVQDVSEGLRSVLDNSPFNVHWHYMDTKRHPDEAFYERAGRTARDVIETWKPRVVIAIDDHAQQYVASCYVETQEDDGSPRRGGPRSSCPEDLEQPDTPIDIVYTGVNAEAEAYGYRDENHRDAANVTGLLQRLPLPLVKSALVETFAPDCVRRRASAGSYDECTIEVLYLRDDSTTSNWREREIMDFAWGPEFRLTSRAVGYRWEWQQELLNAPEQFGLVLFSDYRKLREVDNQLVNGDEVVAWNRSCGSLPMVGLGSSYGEIGEALGFSVAPFEQGAAAAEMALDIVEGRPTEDQHVSHGFVVYLRGELQKGHEVSELYRAFAYATGTHFEAKPSAACQGAEELPAVSRD